MKINLFYLFLIIGIVYNCSTEGSITVEAPAEEGIYFPPINSDTWQTKTLSDLGWNANNLQSLLDFLEEKNTKSFIILHEGKIVVESYMNGHDASAPWYWASAGKTLTTTMSGIAQEDGILDINNKVSDYLGEGWTNAPSNKENLITCKHLLSMNSGLDDAIGDNVSKENLIYKADAGTRWAYHNVYKKMQDVIAEASGSTFTQYFNTKLKNRVGMTGTWLEPNDFNVYWSTTRSMARFGLLIYAEGTWNNTQIISKAFLDAATVSSQDINESYGYLWWLNGKTSYRLPDSQFQFNGELIPNAPNDMFAALGRDDQKIYIIPSKKLVVVRMGNSADGVNFARSEFDNELWEKINAVID